MDTAGFHFSAVSKLMRSQGCGGGVGPKVDSSRSFSDKREAAARSKIVNGELLKRANQLPCPRVDEASKDLYNGSARSSVSLFAEPDAKQRKGGKMPRCNGGSSKRSHTHVAVSIDETEVDMKGKAKEGRLSPPKCNDAEKSQTLKQKTILNGKRVDKRYAKALKGKYDSFSVKSGLASFSAAAGGNSTLGFYGLRPDLEDFTERVEDFSLTELLNGSYNCPNFSNKDKGKKSANSNSNILHSVGEVWSILQTRKVKPQIVEIDGACNHDNTHSFVITSGSVASKTDGDKRNTNMPDTNRDNTPCDKSQDSNSKLKNAASVHDSQLLKPKDILELLALPPPKDLEFLLQDAAKPSVASKNYSDLRLGKPALRGCLPPFSWSNASLSHCKSHSDSVKLPTSRSTCHGRWVKMEMPINLKQNSFLSELKSLKYDDSLVPFDIRSVVPAINETELPNSVSVSEQGLPSSGKHAEDFLLSPDSPRALAAAQILSGINALSSKKTADGAIKSPKRPPPKSLRAHSSFSLNEKSENTFAAIPKPKPKSNNLNNMENETRPLKKLKPPLNEKGADFVHSTSTLTTTNGPLQWSMPRSSRSSPNKSFRYPITEAKHYNTNMVKNSFMMPPVSRTFDAASSISQQKPRKVMRLTWNRESGKLE